MLYLDTQHSVSASGALLALIQPCTKKQNGNVTVTPISVWGFFLCQLLFLSLLPVGMAFSEYSCAIFGLMCLEFWDVLFFSRWAFIVGSPQNHFFAVLLVSFQPFLTEVERPLLVATFESLYSGSSPVRGQDNLGIFPGV